MILPHDFFDFSDDDLSGMWEAHFKAQRKQIKETWFNYYSFSKTLLWTDDNDTFRFIYHSN